MAIPLNTIIPKSSGNFMKLEDGKNKFRILSDIEVGNEGWKDNKPFRHRGDVCKIKPEQVDLDVKYKKPKINYFWVMAVWNYATNKVEVLELTQKSIMNSMFNLEAEADWGDLKRYDLLVTKKKEGDRTTYDTQGMPPKPLSEEIRKAFEESEVAETIDDMFDFIPEDELDTFAAPEVNVNL